MYTTRVKIIQADRTAAKSERIKKQSGYELTNTVLQSARLSIHKTLKKIKEEKHRVRLQTLKII